MQFTNNNYAHAAAALERLNHQPAITPLVSEDEAAVGEALSFGTAELGTTTNPMGNTLDSLKSRINEGAGRIEFEFIQKGKGNSQAPTPESFGVKERQDMKELLTINDIKSSVHASVHGESLAGFGQRGFTGEQRQEALREIQRAVHFAGDVTDGGAIVFHLSEWQRPMSEVGKGIGSKKRMFLGYGTEEEDATLYVVDKRNGRMIEGMAKDTELYEPEFETAGADHPNKVGKLDGNGVRIGANDWLDINGNVVPKDANVNQLFDRVPRWNKDETNFKIRKVDYNEIVRRTQEWNVNHKNEQLTPEQMYARTKLQNTILQAKGNSLYHAKQYDEYKKTLQKLLDAHEFYKQLEAEAPEKDHWRLKQQVGFDRFGLTVPDNVMPSQYLSEQIKSMKDSMRHVHESSAAADAQAMEQLELVKNLESVEKYGLQKTAESIAQVGMMAMETTKRKGLKEDLYAAPENFDQHTFGSHPDEMRKIVTASREEMAKKLLREKRAGNMKQAMGIASKHIRATLDIGHMNMWRQYFDPTDKDGKSVYKTYEERQKAFDKWILDKTEKLVKDGIVGHVHLTDNFGYGDEHLTPGQGNVPMKEFLRRMEKLGMKDMIIEPGSYNISSAMPDTMAMIGSPIYGVGRMPRFSHMRNRHFGYNSPSFFIAGAYSPSNDWQPWTETPLE